MQSLPASRHYVALDGWRGIAALMVALHHFSASGAIYRSGLVQGAWVCVDFFFVLSGFVIAANYRDRLARGFGAMNFMLLRWGRLYPLHLCVLLAYVAAECALKFGWGHPGVLHRQPFTGPTSPAALVTNMLLIQGLGMHAQDTWNTVAWSISTEFWTYAVFALLVLRCGRQLMFAAVALAGVMLLFFVAEPRMSAGVARWDDIARCLYGFPVGVLLYGLFERLDATPAAWKRVDVLTLLEAGAVVIAALFVARVHGAAVHQFAPLAFAPIVLVFAFDGGLVSRLLQRPAFVWMGTLSYSIYMIHPLLQSHVLMPAGLLVERALHVHLFRWGVEAGTLRRIWGIHSLQGDTLTVMMLAVLIACSWVTYRWIEAPGRRWARKRLAERRAGAPPR